MNENNEIFEKNTNKFVINKSLINTVLTNEYKNLESDFIGRNYFY